MALDIWFGSRMAGSSHSELSNLYPRPFFDEVTSMHFFSVEHAYQTLKSGTVDWTTYKRYNSGTARKIPGLLKVDPSISVPLMERLILQSFEQNPDAAAALLATHNEELTHENDKGMWRTEFPRIMMMVRDELRNKVVEF